MPYTGRLVLVVGVSGSGKGALLAAARSALPHAVFPVSCTTRAMRPGEVSGESYYFLTEAEFDERIAANAFLEWAAYGGHRYGTLASEILPPLTEGKLVIREVEVQGAQHIREVLPESILTTIFIHAGSWDVLAARILRRAPMDAVEMERRRSRYEDEMAFMSHASHVIENGDGALEAATLAFLEALARVHTT